jgi:hypothetical protein
LTRRASCRRRHVRVEEEDLLKRKHCNSKPKRLMIG